MVSRAVIDEFLAQKRLAIVGASRNAKKFGSVVRRELSAKGYQVLPVHREAETIDNQPCVRSLADLSGQVDGLVLVTPPAETTRLVKEAAAAGIRRVWMQQGAESDEAIRYCEANGIAVVHHECIIMFAEPVGFGHRLHRGILKLVGRLPK
jgi:predicted CoA-binding protein